MAKKVFKFKDKNLELEIDGKNFNVMCDDKLALKLAAMKDKFAEYTDVENVKKKAPKEIIKACSDITNDILGTGAFARIFALREQSIHDCIDVVVFIMNSIGEKYRGNTPNVGSSIVERRLPQYKN